MLSIKNKTINKKILKDLIYCAFLNYGKSKATILLDGFKNLGFYFATQSGISISIEDLKVPDKKKYALKRATNQISRTNFLATKGKISEVERFQKVIDTWQLTNEIIKDNVVSYFQTHDPLNPIYIMAFSGARGNLSQVRQLVGMRGLMADPNGQIIDLSINHNFREGLSLTDYIISSYGARKGIIDTSLKTADSGYLTRRLVDVAQHVIIREIDCKTKRSLRVNKIETIRYGLVGRALARQVIYKPLNKLLAENNQEVTDNLINQFKKYHIGTLNIRSPLTCESSRSICQKCYGWNLAQINIVSLGESVGVIAAQSIGEPGTQLTMRTFHTGGVATSDVNREIRAAQFGQIFFSTNLILQPSRTMYGEKIFIVENNSQLYLLNKDLILYKINLVPGLILFVTNKVSVKKNQKIAEFPIVTNQAIVATKKINSNDTGEVFFQKLGFRLAKNQNLQITNSGLLWVMHGNGILIRPNSQLWLKPNTTYNSNEIISQTKIPCNQSGIIRLKKQVELSAEKYKNYQIITPVTVFCLSTLFESQRLSKTFLLNKKSTIFEFNLDIKTSIFTSLNIAKLKSHNYNLFLGSQLFYSRLCKKGSKFSSKTGNKVLLLPEQHFVIPNESKAIYVDSYEFCNDTSEFLSEETLQDSGIIFLKKKEGVLQRLIFQPGQQLTPIKYSYEINCQFHSKLLYPGESFLGFIPVFRLSYSQIYQPSKKHDKRGNQLNLFLRPITQFTIPKLKKIDYFKFRSKTKAYSVKTRRYFYFSNGGWLDAALNNKRELIGEFLQIKTISEQNSRYKIGLIKSKDSPSVFKFYLVQTKSTNLSVKGQEQLNSHVIQNQVIEPYGIICSTNIIKKQRFDLLNFKNKTSQPERLFYTTPLNYRLYKFPNRVQFLKQNRFFTKKDYLTKGQLVNASGYITKLKDGQLKIRMGKPYFISKGSVLYINNGQFLTKKMEIGLLIYERIISGDIVQGLPRIEQILEARTTSDNGGLIEKFGIMVNHAKGEWFNVLEKTTKRKYDSFTRLNMKTTLKLGEIVKIGTPYIMDGTNPKHLLQLFFEHYYSMYGLYDATFRALIQVQFLLINSIQSVYRNQGIEISSKHIELIIKQMTSKVSISLDKNRLKNRHNNYNNVLLVNKMVDLQHVNYINNALIRTNKPIIMYEPVLLGVTQVALLTESFLSASSFQGTRTILIQAAIEGKMDWLRGLKENVILGNLLPAGTGFHNLTLTSNVSIRVTEKRI